MNIERISTAFGAIPLDSCNSIAELLEEEKVVSVKNIGGKFIVKEECDGYFFAELTPEQLERWALGLLALARGES